MIRMEKLKGGDRLFPNSERQPEAMLSVLLAIIEKTPTGGACQSDLALAYEQVKKAYPSDKTIQRLVRRLNEYFDPAYTSKPDAEEAVVEPAITVRGKKEMRRYQFTRQLTSRQRIDSSQAILMALSVYPQQRQMLAEQFEKILKMVFDHALDTVKEWYGLQNQVDQYVYVSGFSPSMMTKNTNVVSQVLRAIRNGKRVRMDYTRLYDGQSVKRRELEPYGLLCRHGVWYVVGLCCEARERRVFRVDLIENLRIVENSTYKIPADFSLKKVYGSTWGVWTEQETGQPETVRLKVTPGMAKKFSTTTFHDSQKVISQSDGSAEVTFQIVNAAEMLPWLMTWGATVKVLEPQWLQQELAENAQSIVAQYLQD